MIGLLLSATIALAPVADRTPPCIYEDGSGQAGSRCVWDARHMGNGEGNSLLIRHNGDEIIRISHRRAHRLMTTLR